MYKSQYEIWKIYFVEKAKLINSKSGKKIIDKNAHFATSVVYIAVIGMLLN